MKKVVAILLSLVMVLSLAACGSDDKAKDNDIKDDGKDKVVDDNEKDDDVVDDTEEGIAKVGLGVSVDLSASTSGDEEKDPLAQSDATVAGVAFDKDGKIVKVIFDVAQDKVNVVDGVVEVPTEFKSKKELGDDYGMRATSEQIGIGKEWYEQAEFLEDYFVGMTADEVAGVKADDADVLTGATITIDEFQKAIANAWTHAADVEGVEKIGLGINTVLGEYTKDADDKGGATVQFEDNLSLVGIDKDGKILASQTNVAQNSVSFTADGQLDGEYAEGTNKLDLGDDYGMRATSEQIGIGKEWFEQAAAFDEYLVGKDAAGVAAIEIDENGKATDEDLLSGATMTVDAFVIATEEALNTTK